jgi:Ca2+-binding RTX toxin-like protein
MDDFNDVVLEAVGQGFDRASASVNYVLTAGAEIEILKTTDNVGIDAINLTGNEFGQIVRGNNGVNVLNGAGGADSLEGNGGDDALDGGIGNDLLTGGSGTDSFVFTGASFGSDTVADFQNGVEQLTCNGAGGADDFSDLVISGGANALITFPDGSTITLTGVAQGNVDAADFIFGP